MATKTGNDGTRSANNAFPLDTRSSSISGSSEASTKVSSSSSPASLGTYRDNSLDEEAEIQEFPPFVQEPPRVGVLTRVQRALGMKRRGPTSPEYDYFSTPRDELPDGLLKRRKPARHARQVSPKEARRCRRGHVGGFVKRLLFYFPVAVLAFFGVVHLMHALFGSSGFFWDSDSFEDDSFLPNWGKIGHLGEGLADYPTDVTRDVIPIACHSHNDYWRRVPFYDAIHWGCTGTEADVWLFDEDLYVGHNTASLTKNRTFRSLYVNPMLDTLEKMNPKTEFFNGSETPHGIFDEDPSRSLIFLVDFKTAAHDTYAAVHAQLAPLREKDYLTYHDGEKLHQRPITVVGTGNCPFDLVNAPSTHRDIFFDAPLDKMSGSTHSARGNIASPQGSSGTTGTTASSFNTTNSYYASVSFISSIGFVWRGRLSDNQLELIRSQIKGAHEQGLKVRYWDTPSWPHDLRNHVWRVLMREGADMLNVDDLKGAAVESWRRRMHGFW